MNAIAVRLGTVTIANGYSTNVNKVYFDKIPMGLELNEYELPAIFMIDREESQRTEHNVLVGEWLFELQLWHNEVADSIMHDFIRDIFKAIYANSPTATVWDQFKMHPAIVEIKPLRILADLQMIEANRISRVFMPVHYRTRLYDL